MPVTQKFSMAELVDLALCTPEKGAVNFNILQNLLHGILRQMGLEATDLEVALQEKEADSAFSDITTSDDEGEHGPPTMKMKILSKVSEFGLTPARKNKVIADMWKASNVANRVDACEEGIQKLASLIDGIFEENEELKKKFEDQLKEILEASDDSKSGTKELTTNLEKLKVQVEENKKKISEHDKLIKELDSERKKKPDIDPKEFKKMKAQLEETISKETFNGKVDSIQKELKNLISKIPKDEISEIQATLKAIKPKVEKAVHMDVFDKSVEKQEKKIKELEEKIKSATGKESQSKGTTDDEVMKIVEKQGQKIKELEDLIRTLMKQEGGKEALEGKRDRTMLDEAGDAGMKELTDHLREQIDMLTDRLNALSKQLQSLASRVQQIAETMTEDFESPGDADAMGVMFVKLKQMQDQIEGLGKAANNILTEHAQKKRNIVALQKELDLCREVEKSTQIEVRGGNLFKAKVASKADLKCQEFSEELQKMLTRLATNELCWMRTVHDITANMEENLVHLNLDNLEERLQNRFSFIMSRMKDLQGPSARFEQNPLEVEAAEILCKPLQQYEPERKAPELFLPNFPVPLSDPRPRFTIGKNKSLSPYY